MQAAHAAGTINSFDLNYRAKLWDSIGGLEHGQRMVARIVSNVDALFGNEEDLQKGLGIAGVDVESKSKSKLDPKSFFTMIEPARLGGRPVVEWPAVRQPHVFVGRAGPNRGRRWFRVGFDLRFDQRAVARGSPAIGLGSRRAADNLPRRREHGAAVGCRDSGPRRFGARAAVSDRAPRATTKNKPRINTDERRLGSCPTANLHLRFLPARLVL
jgi:hypothetical protein